MKTIKINCDYCGKEFERAVCRLNVNKRRGSKNYCSTEHARKARLGKNHSEEAKRKMRGKRSNYIWKNSPNRKSGPRISMQGKNHPMYGVHRYGEDAPNYGNRGSLNPSYKKKRPCISGKNHWNWKGGITPQNELERSSTKYKDFRTFIFEWYDFTCQICDLTSKDRYFNGKQVKLEVDHIMSFSLYQNLRYNLNNVRVLCKPCHIKYGADPRRRPVKWAISPINRIQ